MFKKKILIGVLAALSLSSFSQAAPPPVIRESVAVCDPNAPSNCLAPPAGGGTATSSPVVSFAQTTTTGAVALASHTYSSGPVLTAALTNAGTVYVGGSSVTTSTGYPLAAGQSISYAAVNSNQIYIVGSDSAEVVNVTGS